MTAELEQLHRYHDQGDARAFSDLVHAHASMVFATARRVTRDASLAEDVAQETFLDLARLGHGITDSVSAWLYRVAWHRACNAVRADATRKRCEAALPEHWPHEEEATWQELEPLIDEALLELPQQQSTLIIEHFLQGRTQGDIARSMGVSQSSVSRLVDQAIESLRSRLKSKGLLCGTGLGAMIAAQSAQAAPAALITSLSKLSMSGLGSGMAAGGAAAISTLLAMKMKLALAIAAVLLVSAAGYDLASKDSWLGQWFENSNSPSKRIKEESMTPSNDDSILARTARLEAEAKALWERNKADWAAIDRALEACRVETELDKQLAILHSVGITISRQAFERVLTRPHKPARDCLPGEFGYNWRKALCAAWAKENPREAIAWFGVDSHDNIGYLMWAARHAIRRDVEAWDIFVKACPSQLMIARLNHWLLDAEGRGGSWAEALKAGVSQWELNDRLEDHIFDDTPEAALRCLRACPTASIRRDAVFGLAPRLTPQQLLELATQDFATNQPVAHYLRLLAGDPTASFARALEGAWSTDVEPRFDLPEELEVGNLNIRLIAERDIYRRWIAVDLVAALTHAARDYMSPESKSWGSDLDSFIFEAMRTGSIDERLINETLAANPDGRDRALTSWYQAQSPSDPAAALQNIIQSTDIEDQVEAARLVLKEWSLRNHSEAAAWLRSQKHIACRAELAATIADFWMYRDHEKALAFAREQGVDLAAPYARNVVVYYVGKANPEVGERLLLSLRGKEGYNSIIISSGGNRFRHKPDDGMKFISQHATGDWQQVLVDEFKHFIGYNHFVKTEPFAQAFSSLDLARLEPSSVLSATSLVLKDFNRGNELKQGMDWTLKLPPSIASAARESFVQNFDLSDQKRRTILAKWIQSAAISADERAMLEERLKH